MTNDSMINAVKNVNVTKNYEIVNQDEIDESDFGFVFPKYDKDNVISETVNLKDVVTLNLFKTITSMNNKLINGRIKDKDAEKIRIDYLKTYVSACNCFINLCSKGSVNVVYDKEQLTEYIGLDDAIFDDAIIEDNDFE